MAYDYIIRSQDVLYYIGKCVVIGENKDFLTSLQKLGWSRNFLPKNEKETIVHIWYHLKIGDIGQ